MKEAFEVAEDFNAIGSCIKKEYTYRIYNSRFKNPFYVNRAYFYPKRLDEDFLDRAAGMFVGTHDFAAVRSVGRRRSPPSAPSITAMSPAAAICWS